MSVSKKPVRPATLCTRPSGCLKGGGLSDLQDCAHCNPEPNTNPTLNPTADAVVQKNTVQKVLVAASGTFLTCQTVGRAPGWQRKLTPILIPSATLTPTLTLTLTVQAIVGGRARSPSDPEHCAERPSGCVGTLSDLQDCRQGLWVREKPLPAARLCRLEPLWQVCIFGM